MSVVSKLRLLKFKSHAHEKVFDWKWGEKSFNRIAMVNLLVGNTRGWNTSYLEIGCAGNLLFHSVAAKRKVGVDPAEGGTHRMTSDAFFAANTEKFDVIFVDGLHEYQQVRRDALNALACVEEGGWIAFHDLLPSTWKEHHVPRLQETWTGDCWKVAVELSQAKGVDFRIVEVDHGVGLMRKTSSNYSVPDLSERLLDAEFDVFVEEVEALPLISFDEAVALILSRSA